MAVASLSLFVALGGVGWAATQLPPGSVGTAQLRNGAVTNRKLANRAVTSRNLARGSVGRLKITRGAVGLLQIDRRAVQARVHGSCRQGTAISAVTASGGVGCNATLPQEVGAAPAAAVTLTPGRATPVAAVHLSAGSPFLVFANPEATIGGPAGEGVRVDCTLSATSTQTVRTRNLRVEIGPAGQTLAGAIPLALPVPGSGATATVSCTDSFSAQSSAVPTVTVESAIDAIQVQSTS
jgi:hypothetical protein